MTTPLKDVKEALGNARKPDLTHLRSSFATYTVRPCEYGCDKYERANFLRATGNVAHRTPTAEDFTRLRVYLRAAMSHVMKTLDSMEQHQANDPNLLDVEGMKRAAYAVDLDTKPGQKIGASFLPHIAPACSSLMMAISQAVACGLLPEDPGTPWRDPIAMAVVALPYGNVMAEDPPCNIGPGCTACAKVAELDGKPNIKGVQW